MLDCLKKVDGKKLGVFAAGVAFGTAGIKVLSSKDAKKLYGLIKPYLLNCRTVCQKLWIHSFCIVVTMETRTPLSTTSGGFAADF